MANNRMYLICNACSEKILLAKDFGSGFSMANDTEALNKFLFEHRFCDKRIITHSPGDFTLGYEDVNYTSRQIIVEA